MTRHLYDGQGPRELSCRFKKMTYLRKFCFLNSSCIRKSITLMNEFLEEKIHASVAKLGNRCFCYGRETGRFAYKSFRPTFVWRAVYCTILVISLFIRITILVQFVLTTRLTSRLYLLQLLDRHRNLVSKALHFSASFTALQRLSKPTPISGRWRLIPSFCQASRILKL